MIDSRKLRRRVADGRVVAVDSDGRDLDRIPHGLGAPTLLVAPVSEAVKRVEHERLVEDLDRSALWQVRGIVVDCAVVESMPDGSFTMGELIEQVRDAGHVWVTTPL